LTTEGESCQGKVTLFRQAFSLVLSCGATAGGAYFLVLALAKLLAGDLRSAVAIVPAMLFLVLGIVIGTTTMLRAKNVRVMGRGLLVRTWLSEFEVTRPDIMSVRRFPFGRTMVIASPTGWFLLGQELSRFDELSRIVQKSTKLINSDYKSDKHLPPIN
jgi:hypothetical protein